MNGALGFQEVLSSPADHQRIDSYKNNGFNSEQVPVCIQDPNATGGERHGPDCAN